MSDKKKPCNCKKNKTEDSEFSVNGKESGGFSLRKKF